MGMKGYQPFRNGVEVGSSNPCSTCGVKQRNQHTLGQLSKCDGIKRAKRIAAEVKAQRKAA